MRMFQFTSTVSKDISVLTIFTDNLARAYTLAYKYFKRNKFRGYPQYLAV